MDEFSKTVLTAALTAAATILGMVMSKAIDFWATVAKEKREFKKVRLEKVYAEIEELKDTIGRVYELSANWKAYDWKAEEYNKAFTNDHELIGKYNKFPEIAAAARETIHWCKIVSFSEKEIGGKELIIEKKELAEKYRIFLQACDRQLDKLT